tara:strand:+ start:2943 stop:3191 length:249 start_codon:yes stop_codon:yes gene_type:complete
MRYKGLSKYDAPLKIQYQWGYDAFKRGGYFYNRHKKPDVFVENRPNIHPNTMQYREWQRGWNDAYLNNLRKVKSREQTRAGS